MVLRQFLDSLTLPYTEIRNRWTAMVALARLFDTALDQVSLALREWWPTTCRTGTLIMWSQVLRMPRRTGETAQAHRDRVATWRTEDPGTRGWVLAEVERQTGNRRVLEFPRDAGRFGVDEFGGTARFGGDPSLTIGATVAEQPALRETLDAVLPPDIGLDLVEPTTFDGI